MAHHQNESTFSNLILIKVDSGDDEKELKLE